MTAKRGMIWKTPWNRGRQISAPPEPFGTMAFFQNFRDGLDTAIYETAILSSLGTAPPFWFGIVGMQYNVPTAPGTGTVNAAPALNELTPVGIAGAGPLSPVRTFGSIDVNPYLVDLLVATVSPFDYISAAIVTVTPLGLNYRIRIYFENQVDVHVDSTIPYVAPADPLSINPLFLPGAFHGLAGGPFDLTAAEKRQWFVDLKATLKIPPIVGKTSHLYSAGSVVGVPGVLPNFGSAGAAQDMTLVVVGAPAPENNLLPVRFPY